MRVGSLRAMSLGLLSKWWWRAKFDTWCLWIKVINAIHHNPRAFATIPLKPSITGTWKNFLSISNDSNKFSIDIGKSSWGKFGIEDILKF